MRPVPERDACILRTRVGMIPEQGVGISGRRRERDLYLAGERARTPLLEHGQFCGLVVLRAQKSAFGSEYCGGFLEKPEVVRVVPPGKSIHLGSVCRNGRVG